MNRKWILKKNTEKLRNLAEQTRAQQQWLVGTKISTFKNQHLNGSLAEVWQHKTVTFVMSVAILKFFLIAQTNGSCVWYGLSHQEGPHWKNKAYKGEALPLNNEKAEALFKRRCPNMYQEYKGEDGQGAFKHSISLDTKCLKIVVLFSSFGIVLWCCADWNHGSGYFPGWWGIFTLPNLC